MERRAAAWPNHFDLPLRNTTNLFLGLALSILISAVVVPFLIGANLTVTVLVEFGATLNEVISTESDDAARIGLDKMEAKRALYQARCY